MRCEYNLDTLHIYGSQGEIDFLVKRLPEGSYKFEEGAFVLYAPGRWWHIHPAVTAAIKDRARQMVMPGTEVTDGAAQPFTGAHSRHPQAV